MATEYTRKQLVDALEAAYDKGFIDSLESLKEEIIVTPKQFIDKDFMLIVLSNSIEIISNKIKKSNEKQ